MTTLMNNWRTVFIRTLFGLLAAVTMSAYAAGPPVANVSKSFNLTGLVPLTATLDGSLSTCPNGCNQINSYQWNLGDGTVPQTGSLTRTNTYRFNGVFNAILTITDDTGLTSTASVTVTVNLPPAESLTSYVQACQTQLNFQSIPDNVSCYSGDLFATPTDFGKNEAVRDFVGYRKITDQVDMAFACRWLSGDASNPSAPISIEMLVHNRSNGNTCFFSAQGFISGHQTSLTSPIIRSPTSSAATTFWDSPSAVNTYARCVGCHIEGAYIATPTIAPFLAKYGLLNNGHDTGSNITYNDMTQSFNKAHVKYHAVVTPNGISAFSAWDNLKQSYMDPGESCSIGCHVIGTLSPQKNIGQQRRGFDTILTSPANELLEIDHSGVMAPYDEYSDYRWINLAIPDGGTENETFAAAKNASSTLVPELLSNCAAPAAMEAHAVGVPADFGFNTVQIAQLPDRLRTFNLKEGLVCVNSDQELGHQCGEYSIRYLCSVNGIDKTPTWSVWYNADVASGDGDHEERFRHQNICGGVTPIAIEAEIVTPGNKPIDQMGPNDRLARFSPFGLTCNNADQVDGKCSNYVVRYDACTTAQPTVSRTLTNANVPSSGSKQLTAAANALVKAQGHNNGWNTQQWNIEPVTNTEYVRLRNPGTNVYLNVSNTAEQTTVGTASFNSTATGEMWIIEPVSGSTTVRLKNLFSGKYLTMADPNSYQNTPDYLPIFSQGLNTGWNTQRWLMQ